VNEFLVSRPSPTQETRV